jgi:phage gp36-like protein
VTYATRQDLTERYGEAELAQLTDRDGRGVIDEAVLGQAQAAADRLIDGYLAGVVTLPLTVAVPLLTDLACAIARRRLYVQAVPEVVQADYADALARLKDIQAGKLSLGLDAGGTAVPASGGAIAVSAPDRVFTDDLWETY